MRFHFPCSCPANKVFIIFPVGHTGLGFTPLWASVLRHDSREAVVWRPEATSVRGWREATIFLGRIPTTFQIRLQSQRSEGQRGDVAVDQLEFLDCALPCESHNLQTFYGVLSVPPSVNYNKLMYLRAVMSVDMINSFLAVCFSLITSSVPLPGKECPAGMIECRREGCVAERQVCDGSDDCGDGTDEDNCGEISSELQQSASR